MVERERLVVTLQTDGKGRETITIDAAPAHSSCTREFLRDLQQSSNDRARLDGDVLVLNASNGEFRYRVMNFESDDLYIDLDRMDGAAS